ncbi:MAG: HAD-IA family hydrolase [Pseudomonadota bacterium]|nr:HAD-IA family hydrolase [Pseudomonadota bacterium]
MRLKALIFDVDGTLADTESAHLAAFNHAFAQAGMPWHWDEPTYTQLLNISGGKERMLHHWRQVQPGLTDLGQGVQDTLERLHALKTAAYEDTVRAGRVPLRPGVQALIEQARAQGLALAIATTTSPANVAVLLRQALGPQWRDVFPIIEDAGTAPRKKPHPQAYQQALARLGVAPHEALALEDSDNGLAAARQARLATLITPTRFTAGHRFAGALRVLPSLQGLTLAQLQQWHASARQEAA